jgi:hypothetical protein
MNLTMKEYSEKKMINLGTQNAHLLQTYSKQIQKDKKKNE